ncbi:protein translocase subunit SecF, partial [bacterium]|nr:protein translocase subunit SecF [bacterium]
IISIRSKFIDEENTEMFNKMTDAVKITIPDATVEQVSSVGPTLGKELARNSDVAMVLVFIAIIAYISWRFQFDYAVIAVVSLFHDVLFIIGVFSILGLVFGTEIDSLFITALLTVVGFSNHDTIVVFDRIRENLRFYSKKATLSEIINGSVNQTLARSINTSVTTLLTLLALYIFGGVTTRDFVLAMILGILIGTYSSIFFASTLLDWYKELRQKGKTVARA